MSRRDRSATGAPWPPPTRRAFVAMLGAAAATLAAHGGQGLLTGREHAEDDRPPRTWTGTTRWIGHC
jgi:hypothetical protein